MLEQYLVVADYVDVEEEEEYTIELEQFSSLDQAIEYAKSYQGQEGLEKVSVWKMEEGSSILHSLVYSLDVE